MALQYAPASRCRKETPQRRCRPVVSTKFAAPAYRLIQNICGVALIWTLVLALAAPPPIWAWGNAGHEAVAYVAWQQLRPETRTRVMQLLMMVPTLHNSERTKSIPGFSDWVADLPPGLSPGDRNLYLFMRAATWADAIKHQWLKDSDVPPANSAKADAILGYADTASHGYWHFVDIGFASDKSNVPPTPAPNAATQIAALRDAIASTGSGLDLLKSYELVWLEHLVGDVHQPLHGTARFYNNASDKGGNTVKIKLPAAMKKQLIGTSSFRAPDELHAFWDDLAGEGMPADTLPLAVSFAKALPPAQVGVSDTDPNDWVQESFTISKKDVYHAPIGKGPTRRDGSSYTITQAYYKTALKDAKVRIALAGARLAKLLNENLR